MDPGDFFEIQVLPRLPVGVSEGGRMRPRKRTGMGVGERREWHEGLQPFGQAY